MNDQMVFGVDRLALPPMDAVFNLPAANTSTTVYALISLAAFIYGWRKPGERVMLIAFFIAGAVASSTEPFFDVIIGCLHPIIGQNAVYTLMGRPMPVWVVAAYIIFYGAFPFLILQSFNRGISRKGVWMWFIVPLIFDLGIEILMLGQNLYFYYGNQPLLVMKWPLYQGAGNAVAVMLGTTVLFFLQPLLNKQSWRWFPAAIVLLPFCGVMGWSAVGIPCFYAVHSQWPNWAVQTAGIATFALASMVIYAIAALVSVDSPIHDRTKQIGFFSSPAIA